MLMVVDWKVTFSFHTPLLNVTISKDTSRNANVQGYQTSGNMWRIKTAQVETKSHTSNAYCTGRFGPSLYATVVRRPWFDCTIWKKKCIDAANMEKKPRAFLQYNSKPRPLSHNKIYTGLPPWKREDGKKNQEQFIMLMKKENMFPV